MLLLAVDTWEQPRKHTALSIRVVHRERRRRLGLATEEDVVARARGLLNQEAWLREKGRDLARMLDSRG